MANTIITPTIIAREVLHALLGNIVFRDLLFRAELSNEMVSAKAGDTINVKKPSKFKMKRFTDGIIKQDMNESSIPVKLDFLGDISVEVSSKEMTLEIDDFVNQIIRPIGEGMAIGIDSYIANKIYQAVPSGNIVTATGTPTNLKDIADLGLKLDLAKAPKQGRTLVLSPSHKVKYAILDNLSAVNYAGDSITLRDALLGRVYGFQTLESNYLPVGSGGGTAKTITKITVAGNAGSKTVAVVGLDGATVTLKKGDLLITDGRVITVNKDATASGSNIDSLSVIQSELDDMANGDYEDVVISKADVSLAFSDVAFGLVNVPLELPMNNPSSAIASYEGITVRVHYGYDQDKKKQILSVDTLFGFAEFYEETSALLIGN